MTKIPCYDHRVDFSYCPVANLQTINAVLLEALRVALTSVEWMADATDADPEDAERLAFVKEAIRKAEETL